MKILHAVFGWLASLLLPLALLFLGLRLLLTGAFLQLEYHLPGFPADEYGFTRADRLHYAPLAVDYLLNDAGIDFLADQTFPDGTPLYNERELSHMHDVKLVVQGAVKVGYATWFLLLGIAFWARWGGWWPGYVRAVRRGGWITVGLLAALGLLAGTDFWAFFTDFHALFFQGDSWMFLYSDTLIRLFPLFFWEFAIGCLLGVAGLSGLLLGLLLKPDRSG
jgi:integral membrane protein (TIGR01906 family)